MSLIGSCSWCTVSCTGACNVDDASHKCNDCGAEIESGARCAECQAKKDAGGR
jgi:hypothetical protein